METKLTLPIRAFEDVYGQGLNPSTYTGPKYTQTITPTSNNVCVHDCVFSFCSSSSNGGALNCDSSVYKLLIEQTTFISCSTSSSYGGGIFFDSKTSGECVLSKICGFNCSSTIHGPCAYVYVKNDANYKNHVNDSSLTNTLKLSSGIGRVLWLYYGNILCPSVNISNNECHLYTAIRGSPTVSSASDTFFMSYSSIVNNTAIGNCGLIDLNNQGSSMCIATCNILNNKQTSYSGLSLTIFTNANLLIKDSCFLGNNEGNKVFYISSPGIITISNCTIDDDIISSEKFTGSVTFTKIIERSFIHALSHISTQKCDSYFDSYGTLTVNPNIPSRRTKNRCSCNIQRPMIDPLRIIEFIFLLTMLHSDPSNDYYFNSNRIFTFGI